MLVTGTEQLYTYIYLYVHTLVVLSLILNTIAGITQPPPPS
jgi:hypothetical protein